MDTPQFKTAEYSTTKPAEACKTCGQAVGAVYYRVNGDIACEGCALKAKSATPTASHAAFMRGLFFGIGGAIAGLAIYATFAIATGLVIGYVSLAVGYVVGKAVKMGSRGFGGSHYQIAAVVLTYAAVSMAAVPISIAQVVKQRQAHPPTHAQRLVSPSAGTSNPTVGAPDANGSDESSAPKSPSQEKPMGFGRAMLALVFVGLASPFLELMQDPFHGLIGLVILGVGIRIAWQLTAGDDHASIVGPFKNPAAAPPAPASLG